MNMFTPEEIAEFRADARSRMGAENGSSDANVYRKTGRMIQNEENGREQPEWERIHHLLPFRLGGSPRGASGSRTLTVGGVEITMGVRVGHMPWDTADLRDGDHVDIVAGENQGVVVRIIEADWQDQATARRVPVLTVDRPKEWALL